MAETLDITREAPSNVEFRGQLGHSMVVRCSSSIPGMSPKIFVIHAQAGIQGDDIFSCVASLQQLQELPEDLPGSVGSEGYPFYLTDEVKFLAYTLEELDRLWGIIREDANSLVNNFKLQGSYNTSSTESIS